MRIEGLGTPAAHIFVPMSRGAVALRTSVVVRRGFPCEAVPLAPPTPGFGGECGVSAAVLPQPPGSAWQSPEGFGPC